MVIGEDTLVVFTDFQVKLITQTFISEEYLQQEVIEYNKIIKEFDAMLDSYYHQVESYKGLILTKNDEIRIKESIIHQQKLMIKEEKKKRIRAIIYSSTIGFTIGVLTMILI